MIHLWRNFLKKNIWYPYVIKRKISQWKGKKVVLIVSTGRTGTKFFEGFFNSIYDNVYCVHEPFPDLSQEGADYLKGKMDSEYLKYIFLNSRNLHLKNLTLSKKNIYIESNGGLSYILPVLHEILPPFKVVHIVRNAKDWVRSAYSRQIKDGSDLKLIYLREEAWKLRVDEITETSNLTWNNMNLIEKLAWTWKTKNENIMLYLSNYKNGITVKFEDIFYKDHCGLDEILDYLDDYQFGKNKLITSCKDLLPDQVNSTSKFAIPDFDEWDVQDKIKFETITSSLMRELGYL